MIRKLAIFTVLSIAPMISYAQVTTGDCRDDNGNAAVISSLPLNITSPGLYCLGSTLTHSGTNHAINISANNVTLDLNGHSLLSADDNERYGIEVGGSNITLRNGTIEGYTSGITLVTVNNTDIEKVLVDNIRVIESLGSAITTSEINLSSDIVIQKSVFADNVAGDVRLGNSINVSIKDNSFLGISSTQNGNASVRVVNSANATIQNNRFSGYVWYYGTKEGTGVSVENSNPNPGILVLDNTFQSLDTAIEGGSSVIVSGNLTASVPNPTAGTVTLKGTNMF